MNGIHPSDENPKSFVGDSEECVDCGCDNCICVDGECQECGCENCECDPEDQTGNFYDKELEEPVISEDDQEFEDPIKLEKKKIPAGLRAYLDKRGPKKSEKKEDKKEDKKNEKEVKGKGLTAKQKKLPEALQKSILKNQGK